MVKKTTKAFPVALFSVFCCRDPNNGELKVPARWPTFTSTGHQFLEINSKMDVNYIQQKMRMRYVHFWTSVLPSLTTTISE